MSRPRRPARPLHRGRAGLVAVALLVGGCGTDSATRSGPSDGHGADHTLGHVHGLGVDPGDGTLYIASHLGVFRHDDTGLERVADRWQDTMAFTVVGPEHFLASGHPDLREDLPAQLGLIESTDAARTWQPLSLQGRADFHALEPFGDALVGYEALSGTLRVTTDRTRWRVLDQQPVVDLAAVPAHRRLWATTAEGRLLEYQLRQDPRAPVAPVTVDAPPMLSLDADPAGRLVGLGADGTVYRSDDQARTWQQAGAVRGAPEALEVTGSRWLAATTFGVQQSTDDGRTWTRLAGVG